MPFDFVIHKGMIRFYRNLCQVHLRLITTCPVELRAALLSGRVTARCLTVQRFTIEL